MAGRPSKPTNLILLEGKSHRTKAELTARAKSEAALKSNTVYKPSDAVKADKIALKEFNKLKKLYKDIDYVEGLDENVINRYCLILSEEYGIRRLIAKMNDDIDNCEEFTDRLQLYGVIDGCMGKIKSTREMLLKLEDRLFLNPTSRIKAIPKKLLEKEEADPMEAIMQKRPHKSG